MESLDPRFFGMWKQKETPAPGPNRLFTSLSPSCNVRWSNVMSRLRSPNLRGKIRRFESYDVDLMIAMLMLMTTKTTAIIWQSWSSCFHDVDDIDDVWWWLNVDVHEEDDDDDGDDLDDNLDEQDSQRPNPWSRIAALLLNRSYSIWLEGIFWKFEFDVTRNHLFV